MKIVDWAEFIAGCGRFGPTSLAIGAFDGLHIGHRALIERVLARPEPSRGIVTFRTNPKKLLRPSSFHGDLATLDQKLETLEAMGVEVCVLIDFSGDFSKLAGRKFLDLLRDCGDLRYIAVGSDFRCGHRLDTGAEDLRRFYEAFGIRSEVLEPVLWGGQAVSSSRVRKAVAAGELEAAEAMLGRRYEIDLRPDPRPSVAEGSFAARVSGAQVQPPPGEYDVEAVRDGGVRAAGARFDGERWSVSTPVEAGASPESGTSTGPSAPREARASREPFRPEAIRLVRLVSRE